MSSVLSNADITLCLLLTELLLGACSSCFHSDVCVGQSQDDSILGMKQSKQIPPALPVSGNLSSSNPDLLQSHHRILDFNNQPGGFLLLKGRKRVVDQIELHREGMLWRRNRKGFPTLTCLPRVLCFSTGPSE